MSYILDALKKLEQRREQEEPSKLPTFTKGRAIVRRKSRLWPYALLGALLLNAAIMTIWWVRPLKDTEEAVKGAPAALEPQVPAESRRDEAKTQRPLSIETKEVKPVAPRVVARPEEAPSAAPRPSVVAQSKAEPDGKANEPKVRKGKTAGPVDPAFSFRELPPFIRNDLPEFKVSGHAYSQEPGTRVVRVNEKILQEGQELSAGLRVEEIIPDGVVFSYQGYRFRIGVNHTR
jgi:general secretion pathway protein B